MSENPFLVFLAQAESPAAASDAAAETTTAAPLAAPPTAPKREGGLFDPSMFFMMAVVLVASIFLLQRPEKKRQEERLKALEGMKKGDKVITTSGMHGVVSRVNKEKETIFVTVAKDVEIEFSKAAVNPYTEPKAEPKKSEPTADAKQVESPKKVKA
ncbi:MAG TPA: preprotein translocase subunit YajC [Candidatus Sumerlaeota bacterium]|nr:preprotein translocase subunit YajC [Candidatus Sumerlaeota bacterium]HMZ53145.1 preprotein translocase subunit YajC [Candidatus Sumerlaeota bacterium]